MKSTRLSFLFLLAVVFPRIASTAEERPNILWITCEDMSPVLGCYGDEAATTPHLDQLATESVRYTHAFATAPVCSPSRSCLINGVYAQTQGTHNMRSAYPIPEHLNGFPALLREAGYWTSNNVKTDYNSARWSEIIEASWNRQGPEAHWRQRDKDGEEGDADPGAADQPFFSVFNLMESHQSRAMVWPTETFKTEIQSQLTADEIHDPATIPLPSYYPDTPVIRETQARFYDCVTAMDKKVGALLQQLADDGLDESTIVFFFADHGSGLPRHKRALLDSGMHVPLLVRVPETFKRHAIAQPGATHNRLISFVDFAPTVLSLTGIDIPDVMQGRAFLGDAIATYRDHVFGHRDRVDEVIDMARSVRTRDFLYIRNYMPHLGYNQPTAWPDLGAIRHEFYRLADAKTMTPAQWHFAGPTRPAVELYDCKTDPLNLNNLADDPKHRVRLHQLEAALLTRAFSSHRDLGCIPESLLNTLTAGAPAMEWSAEPQNRNLVIQTWTVLQGLHKTSQRTLRTALTFPNNPAIHYWAATALADRETHPGLLDTTKAALRNALTSEHAAVRTAAADTLLRRSLRKAPDADTPDPLDVLIRDLEHEDMAAVLHAARVIQLLGDTARDAIPAMRACKVHCEKINPPGGSPVDVKPGRQDMAMFVLFALDAFLETHDAPAEEANWIDLFDGKTLDGWPIQPGWDVTVVDGEIHMLSKGKNLWLLHEGVYTNFEIQAEVHMPADAYNSGLGFRCGKNAITKPGKPPRFGGYQCEVDKRKSGMIYSIGSGWVWPKGKEETARFHEMADDSFKDNDWNHLRVRADGDHLQIWINDTLTADVRDARHAAGSIALQHHGKGDVHKFRNIRLLPLP